MGKKYLSIRKEGSKIGNRIKRINELGKRIRLERQAKIIDKSIKLSNKFLDLKNLVLRMENLPDRKILGILGLKVKEK